MKGPKVAEEIRKDLKEADTRLAQALVRARRAGDPGTVKDIEEAMAPIWRAIRRLGRGGA